MAWAAVARLAWISFKSDFGMVMPVGRFRMAANLVCCSFH